MIFDGDSQIIEGVMVNLADAQIWGTIEAWQYLAQVGVPGVCEFCLFDTCRCNRGMG